MYACTQEPFLVSHPASGLPNHTFPTPSPSPPWERGTSHPSYITLSPPPTLPPATLLSCGPSPVAMTTHLVHNPSQMMILSTSPQAKDSRWLTLEVCREFQRSKCSRTDTECKFAHPPPHVEVQNGRVVACFDSIKGKCQRKEPPCKYLHPPQHLREQLLQNGRNNLILKNLQVQAYQQAQFTGVLPVTRPQTSNVPDTMPGYFSYLTPYSGLQALSTVPTGPAPGTYSPYLTSLSSLAIPTSADSPSPVMSPPLPHSLISGKTVRADKFEHSSAPGIMTAYKRIAVGDLSKAGYPVYSTSQLISPLAPASLMQLQQPTSYIPMTYAGHAPSVPRY